MFLYSIFYSFGTSKRNRNVIATTENNCNVNDNTNLVSTELATTPEKRNESQEIMIRQLWANGWMRRTFRQKTSEQFDLVGKHHRWSSKHPDGRTFCLLPLPKCDDAFGRHRSRQCVFLCVCFSDWTTFVKPMTSTIVDVMLFSWLGLGMQFVLIHNTFCVPYFAGQWANVFLHSVFLDLPD